MYVLLYTKYLHILSEFSTIKVSTSAKRGYREEKHEPTYNQNQWCPI